MRILGIDPGYERLGIAVLERTPPKSSPKERTFESASPLGGGREEVVLFSECFKTSAKLEFAERLRLIGEEIRKVIKKYKPTILSIETLFLNTNQKTVMRVAEARGVVVYEATCAGLKIFEATPLQIKMAVTGYGKSDKTQVTKMVKMLIKVDESKKSDDELDAIAAALTASACLRN